MDGRTSSQKVLRVEYDPPSERSFRQASNALMSVNRSLPAVANFARRLKKRVYQNADNPLWKPPHAVASSRLSIGFRKSGLDERQAAAVRVGSRQRKIAPRIIIYERFTSVLLTPIRIGPTLASFTSTGSVALGSHQSAL